MEKQWLDEKKHYYHNDIVDADDPRLKELLFIESDQRFENERSVKEDDKQYSDKIDLLPTFQNIVINGDQSEVLRSLTYHPEYSSYYRNKIRLVTMIIPDNDNNDFLLTKIRDLLKESRELLSDDGSIWVITGSRNVHYIRTMMDKYYGDNSFVADVIWEKSSGRENRANFSFSHDHILVYSKASSKEWAKTRNRLPHVTTGINPDNDPRGSWFPSSMVAPGHRPKQMYDIISPTGKTRRPPEGRCWSMLEETYLELLDDNRIYFSKNGNGQPVKKNFASDSEGLVPNTLWMNDEVGSGAEGKREVKKLLSGLSSIPPTIPERLAERIIHISSSPGDIILDIFGGSGTVPAAAQKMGRQWMVIEENDGYRENIIVPRLKKVIRNEDNGGISSTPSGRLDMTEEGLPGDMTTSEAGKLTSLINNAIRSYPELKKSKDIQSLKSMVKTSPGTKIFNYLGGGGFTTMNMSTPVFDYDPDYGLLMIKDVDKDTLSRSLCAQLSYQYQDDPRYCGLKGKQLLSVVDTMVSREVVDEYVDNLPEDHIILIAATSMSDDIPTYLSSRSPGSRIIIIPQDIW